MREKNERESCMVHKYSIKKLKKTPTKATTRTAKSARIDEDYRRDISLHKTNLGMIVLFKYYM